MITLDTYSDAILLSLVEHGYQGRIVTIRHLSELREEIEERFNEGLFDEEFYRSRLAFFDFDVPEILPHAQ
jgi:hypothetical protein